ncbi:hypothetical protein [Chryseobacterium taeanense]|nr:hypothetical protein [Chryseobacterium taeanense]
MAVLFISLIIKAQVGINNTSPKATLDITAKTTGSTTAEGLIAPRLEGVDIKGKDAKYDTAQKGAIVYALSAVASPTTKTANITAEGYYYFDGGVWQKMTGAAAGDTTNDAWINDTTNGMVKLGTKADGTARSAGTDFVVKDNGQVGIGTNAPSANLEVNSGTLNDSGLKLTQLTSSTSATSGNVAGLGVDGSGKIVVVGGSTQVNRYTFSSSAAQGSNPSFIPNINSQTINLISGSSRSGNVITLPQGTYEVVFTLGGGFTGASIANYFDERLYVNNSFYQVLASYSTSGTNEGFMTGVGVFTLNSTGTIYVGSFIQVGVGAWNFNNSNTSLVIKKLL